MPQTLTEKLLAKAAGQSAVTPGETVLANVDVVMIHDVTGPAAIGVFHREFGDDAKVWDPKRVVVMPDHYIFTCSERSQRNVDGLRSFANEQRLPYFYDVIDDPQGHWHFDADAGHGARQFGSHFGGVCHSALPERGHTVPGEVLIGADSHTCTAGAFGEFATGVGSTDAAFAMGTGKILLRVPESMQFVLTGQLPVGVMAKDVILHIIGQTGVDGATYQAMEFGGEGVGALSMEDRMTITNMAIEAGAKNGIFPADEQTRAFVDNVCLKNGTTRPYECLTADADAAYVSRYEIDLSAMEPVVACPPDPAGLATARDRSDVAIDRVYIGSCTGGKVSDFDAFAAVVRGRTVSVDTFGVPSTPAVLDHLTTATIGDKTLWNILVDAGVTMSANPGCAACLGGPTDTFGRMNEPLTCVATTNRNFPGRMGHLEGRIYLASPLTAAASALAGRIADPRDVLQ